jgi:hypothetical protein
MTMPTFLQFFAKARAISTVAPFLMFLKDLRVPGLESHHQQPGPGVCHGFERFVVAVHARVAGQRAPAPPSKFSKLGGFRKSVFIAEDMSGSTGLL